jgi:hypothetical protein
MSTPLTSPETDPTSTEVKSMTPTPYCWVATVVLHTLANASRAPTDRSIPPLMMTKVIPIAMTPTLEARVRTVSSLVHSRSACRKMSGRLQAPIR